jgi:exodeoxyribonuclease III
MRITTWNINGLRAVLKKGFKEWVLSESPDVLCLQEIKVTPAQLSAEHKEYPGYSVAWNAAERLGYSGVASFFKTQPLALTYGIGEARFDIEGRVICSRHPDFLLFNIYFPNGQRGKERLDYKLDFYARLLELCDTLQASGENIIITGDFNTAHMPIDLAHPKENVNNSGFMPEERAWVDQYLQHGFVDIYRQLYPERVQYTWWTYISAARQRNVGWRIDYFLISERLVSRVKDVIIHDEIPGSDHCPVSLDIE